jgi:hypothetical protein
MAGGIIGCIWGGLVGGVGILLFVFLHVLTDVSKPTNLPDWCKSHEAHMATWVIAGAFVGFLIELAHFWDEHTMLKRRWQALATLSDDLAGRFYRSEQPADGSTIEHIRTLPKPMD